MRIILVYFFMFMVGCVGMDGQQSMSPFEVKLLAKNSVALGIHATKMKPAQVEKLLTVVKNSRGIVQLAIKEDPSNLEPVTLEITKNLEPLYASALSDMMNIIIFRIRPYIQEGGDLKLAAEYADAVFDGAIMGCELALASQADTT